jgi:hypothetical protein
LLLLRPARPARLARPALPAWPTRTTRPTRPTRPTWPARPTRPTRPTRLASLVGHSWTAGPVRLVGLVGHSWSLLVQLDWLDHLDLLGLLGLSVSWRTWTSCPTYWPLLDLGLLGLLALLDLGLLGLLVGCRTGSRAPCTHHTLTGTAWLAAWLLGWGTLTSAHAAHSTLLLPDSLAHTRAIRRGRAAAPVGPMGHPTKGA